MWHVGGGACGSYLLGLIDLLHISHNALGLEANMQVLDIHNAVNDQCLH